MTFEFDDIYNRPKLFVCFILFIVGTFIAGLLIIDKLNIYIVISIAIFGYYLIYSFSKKMTIEIVDNKLIYHGVRLSLFGHRRLVKEYALSDIVEIRHGLAVEVVMADNESIFFPANARVISNLVNEVLRSRPSLKVDMVEIDRKIANEHGGSVTGTSVAVVMLIAVFGSLATFIYLLVSQ